MSGPRIIFVFGQLGAWWAAGVDFTSILAAVIIEFVVWGVYLQVLGWVLLVISLVVGLGGRSEAERV